MKNFCLILAILVGAYALEDDVCIDKCRAIGKYGEESLELAKDAYEKASPVVQQALEKLETYKSLALLFGRALFNKVSEQFVYAQIDFEKKYGKDLDQLVKKYGPAVERFIKENLPYIYNHGIRSYGTDAVQNFLGLFMKVGSLKRGLDSI